VLTFINFVTTYWPLIFLFFYVVLVTSAISLTKRPVAGIRTINISMNWPEREIIALLSMVLSLLAWLWIENFGLIFNHRLGLFGNMMHFWPIFLLFAVSAGLSLALKRVKGLLIALPYLLLLGEGFFWFAWILAESKREAGVALRAVSQIYYALALPIAIIALLWEKDATMKNKIYAGAFAIQLALAIGSVYYYKFHYR